MSGNARGSVAQSPSSEPALSQFLPSARELAGLFAARGLTSALAWQSGFRALSDDDYARITIAQRFARLPSLDPSGTSWLPAPFWAYGAMFRLFGPSLGVARGTALVASLFATVLVYVAARVLGAPRAAALASALFSCIAVPYSAILGIAAVPEVPSAALCVFAACTLCRGDPQLRALGALALGAACLSRYEAWPVALVFLGVTLWDAVRRTSYSLGGAAALALTAPASWLTHGWLRHGNALFFVARVTAYQRALGGAHVSTWPRLLEYPRHLLGGALGLWLFIVACWLVGRRARAKPNIELLSYGRAGFALLTLLALLMLGSARDAAPTHHAGRALLPIWFFGCVIAGTRAARFVGSRIGPGRLLPFVVSAWPLVSLFVLPQYSFAHRELEIEAGRAARQFTDTGLVIDTPDFGYFAVQAGFGSPLGASALDEHDPRQPRPAPFGSAQAIERALRNHHARFAVVTTEHASSLDPRCTERWRNARFVLFSCAPTAG